MCRLDALLDTHPERAAELAQLDDRNRQAHHELEVYNATGIFPACHPIAVQFLADRKTEERLLLMRKQKPEKFMQQVTNCTQNIRRIESRLKNKHYKDDSERERWEHNLTTAQRLLSRMEKILNK